MQISVEQIAEVGHEVNRAYCLSIGDTSQSIWEYASAWVRESAINGVKFHIKNPYATPEMSHDAWMEEKRSKGWTYGAVKDGVKKEHPCFLPYCDLPVEQKAKDYIFQQVVHSLSKINIWMSFVRSGAIQNASALGPDKNQSTRDYPPSFCGSEQPEPGTRLCGQTGRAAGQIFT